MASHTFHSPLYKFQSGASPDASHSAARQKRISYTPALACIVPASATTYNRVKSAKMSSARLKFRKTHRRTASLPSPAHSPKTNGSTDDNDENDNTFVLQEDTHQSSAINRPVPELRVHVERRQPSKSTSVDVAELLHSPTFYRRSVSSFNFQDIQYLSSYDIAIAPATPVNMSLHKPKLHRSTHNISTCTSSTESLREDHRSFVLKELLKTERNYIGSLETLMNVFLPRLETIMSPRDVRLLFPCQLEPLIALHNDLLSRLDERIEGRSRYHGMVGDIFGRLCSDKEGEFTSLYSAYMNEFKIAMETLARYERTSPLFCKTTNDCCQLTECEGLSLAAYLLTPIQRIPRYELLLKELVKHTSHDNPDCYYIESALDRIHSTLLMLNHSIQACELACTIGRFKDVNRSKRKTKRRKRYHSVRLAARIKRHLSQNNLDDLSSPSNSPRMSIYRTSSVLEKSSFRSELNLHEKEDIQDDDDERESQSFLNRAISVSDVYLLDPEDIIQEKTDRSKEEEEEEEEEEVEKPILLTTHDPSVSRSPSITSQDSVEINPPILLNTNRASIYSSNSSTSGIDSLLGTDYSFGGEETGTLKHIQSYDVMPSNSTATLKPCNSSPLITRNTTISNNSSQLTNDSSVATNSSATTNSFVATNSIDSGYDKDTDATNNTSTPKLHPKLKKKTSFSSALKVFRKTSKDLGNNSPLSKQKRSTSLGQINKIEISQPADFRHIQHGFSNRPISTVL